ncbi:hypothetical protein BKA82DRAFT_991347 [Pisolithus tinctorius]|uniref:Uncharacterized protein n=1 Tax=Pisolithus tinctorius Marx 270 TaxID=870435 RepID=A0A0C3PK55_PISTI|nr:hypothetical protein BKA82DRAFT_991347 [Pisolithus tinctorius]KIO14585.1 hypothetical protein M404DRAFT_991347 [Pisolithus tinctorius Marx 270]
MKNGRDSEKATLRNNLWDAQRDNDLIYHRGIPLSTAIGPTQETVMVKNNVPPGLLDPKNFVGSCGILFGGMLG